MNHALLRYVDSFDDVLVADPQGSSGRKKVFVKRYIDTELVISEPSSERRKEIF
ncbi:hypothetical protein A2U01_0066450, partial [Trifolium medium]|nr:hypothetical protein [Trifolium medium]